MFVITFAGNVTLGVVTSLVRSVDDDSTEIASELAEFSAVFATDSTLFVIESGELAACATVVDIVLVVMVLVVVVVVVVAVAVCDSLVSVGSFGVVNVEDESCEVVEVDMDVNDDDDDGCVTSIEGYCWLETFVPHIHRHLVRSISI